MSFVSAAILLSWMVWSSRYPGSLCIRLFVFWMLTSVGFLWADGVLLQFDIPKGEIVDSLKTASRQADVGLLISIDVPIGTQAAELKGGFTAKGVFDQLLSGTNLKAVAAKNGDAFVIVAQTKKELSAAKGLSEDFGEKDGRKRSVFRVFKNWGAALSGSKKDRQLKDAGDAESIFMLSPFEVNAYEDKGYLAVNTLSGTRLNTAVKDLGTTLSIMTPQLWEDAAATSVNDMIIFTPGSEPSNTQQNRGNADILFWGDTTVFRGIHTENILRNQFRSNLPSDTYNAERFEFSRGPNAVLFGINRAPAGLVNRTTQDANFHNQSLLRNRIDNNGSSRNVANLNVVLLEDTLAMRFAFLEDRHNSWIEQGFQDQDRMYLALNYTPNERLSVKARVETVDWERVAVDPSFAKDNISAWVRSGRPSIDVSAEDEDVEFPEGVVGLTESNVYGYVNDGSGRMMNLRNFALGDETILLSGEPVSVSEDQLPLDYNHFGGFASQYFSGDNAQLVLQYRVGRWLNFEYAVNSEYMLYDFISAEEEELYVDVNATLDDGATSNEHYGELFTLSNFNFRLKQDRYLRSHRFSASLNHDFSGSKKWGFLGNQQGVVLLEKGTDEFYWDTLRLINVTPPADAEEDDRDRSARVITYLNLGEKSFSGPTAARTFDSVLNSVPGNDYRWLNGLEGGNRVNRTTVDSFLFVWQGAMFDRRVIPTIGWRRDSIEQFDTAPIPFPRATAREQSYSGIPEISGVKPQTSNRGVVINAIRDKAGIDYISFFYNKADSFAASNFNRTPENKALPPRTGETEDYGMRFGLAGGRVSGVVTVFDSQSKDDLVESGLEAITLLGDLFGMIGRDELNDVPQVNDTQDLVSEGWELQVTGNFLRGLRTVFTYDHYKTYDSNVAPNLVRLIDEFSDDFLSDPDRIVPDQGTKTAGEIYEEMTSSLSLRLAQVGGFKNNERQNKATVLSTYEFQEGLLKGLAIGGSVIWRDRPSTGFPFREDPELGLIPDVKNPFWGDEMLNLSMHVAYERPVFNRLAKWKIQLNISNIGDQEPFVIRHSVSESEPSSPIIQSISKGQPQLFVLTNSLTF